MNERWIIYKFNLSIYRNKYFLVNLFQITKGKCLLTKLPNSDIVVIAKLINQMTVFLQSFNLCSHHLKDAIMRAPFWFLELIAKVNTRTLFVPSRQLHVQV